MQINTHISTSNSNKLANKLTNLFKEMNLLFFFALSTY